MRFGTRLVLYYSLTSVVVLLFVGIVVVKSIESYWINQVEVQLSEQNAIVQDYIKQVFLFEKEKTNELSENNAKLIASNLSSGIGQLMLYSNDLKLLSGLVDVFEHPDFNMKEFESEVLQPAQNGVRLNYIQNNIYYLASPIEKDGKAIGVLVINYKLDLLNLIIQKIVFILCLGAAAFCLVIIILSILISRKMVVPIKKLVSTTEKYARREFTMVNIDRTDELGQLSKSINDMGMQLKEHINQQKKFISNVSHEIRTPLAAIKGYTEYLSDEVMGEPEMDKVIFHLKHETERLTNMVNDLLQMARLDAYQENFTFSKVNLSNVVEEILGRMNDRAASKNIELSSTIKAGIFVDADKDKLAQVLVNLLDNSIKYSPDDSRVRIDVSAEDNYSTVTIADQGIGIPEGEFSKVFDRFYRAGNVKGIAGTGLGLAISKEIIEKHHGQIILDHSKEGGTEATIVLPMGK